MFQTGKVTKFSKIVDPIKECEPKHEPMKSYLQLRPNDFAPKWNRDFTIPGNVPQNQNRGGRLYVAPAGWFRLALNCDKYNKVDPSDWLGMSNTGEWPVAYHGFGRHNDARALVTGVASAIGVGLLPGAHDVKFEEAVRIAASR